MKKVTLLVAGLFLIAGTTFAEGKNGKKACKNDATAQKACCKKDDATAKSGTKACCKKDHGNAETVKLDAPVATPAQATK